MKVRFILEVDSDNPDVADVTMESPGVTHVLAQYINFKHGLMTIENQHFVEKLTWQKDQKESTT